MRAAVDEPDSVTAGQLAVSRQYDAPCSRLRRVIAHHETHLTLCYFDRPCDIDYSWCRWVPVEAKLLHCLFDFHVGFAHQNRNVCPSSQVSVGERLRGLGVPILPLRRSTPICRRNDENTGRAEWDRI